MTKWSKAQRTKFTRTLNKKKNAVNEAIKNQTAKPLTTEYVGEQPKVDIQRLEDRAFRRGMFTAFQMIIDLFLRELR